MSHYQKEKRFLNLPRLQGDKTDLRDFVKENLQYPPEALENKIEGDVIVKIKISDNGDVFDLQIIKGLGYGCDEEAMRLAKMMKYYPVKNRGVRVSATNKIKIPFRLPQKRKVGLKMEYTTKNQTHKKDEKTPPEPEKGKETYTYTIKF